MGSKTDAVRTTRRRRRSHDDSVAPDPAPLSDALPRLVTALDEAAEAAGWGARPSLVRVTSWPTQPAEPGFDLGIRPLDDEGSVVEALAGFTAPAEWMAIGVVTEGSARHLVDVRAERRRVRCVHLVDRTGASASTLRLQGEPATLFGLDEEHGRGRIDDACRRALALPTEPPEHTTIELWALVWLDRTLAALAAAGEVGPPVTWQDVAAQHPAVAVLRSDAEELGDAAADNLVRLGAVLADVHSWPVLRAACAAGEWPVDDIAPEVAAWLDDGSFSRWVLGGYPPIEQLTDSVCELVPPSLRRRVRAALRSWALLS
ncbi:MAG TPA: hypothetical protein VFV00_00325 [Acidimicrobiales bacterium]|nr:hypothetical protein [Acidimicrobiales bacterium]